MKTVQKAGGIVLNPSKQILIIKNELGNYTLPKGSVEAGETSLQAAVREIAEESGLTGLQYVCKLGTIERPGYTNTNHHQPSVTKRIQIFLFRSNATKFKPKESHYQASWQSLPALDQLLRWPEELNFIKKHRTQF